MHAYMLCLDFMPLGNSRESYKHYIELSCEMSILNFTAGNLDDEKKESQNTTAGSFKFKTLS